MLKDVVFFLHRVYPKRAKDDLNLKDFQRAINLIRSRFKIVPLEEILSGPGKERRAAITFDDGYADNFVYAYPILKKLGIPAHLFITSGRINSGKKRKNLLDYWEGKASLKELYSPKSMFDGHLEFLKTGKSEEFLSWEEIEEMGDVFSFGAHGKYHLSFPSSAEVVDFFDGKRAHWTLYTYSEKPFKGLPVFKTKSSLYGKLFRPKKELLSFCREFAEKEGSSENWKKRLHEEVRKRFRELGSFESEEEATQRIEKELLESKREIEDILNVKVTTFSWPFGQYSEFSMEIASRVYDSIFTIKKGLIGEESSRRELPRVSLGKDIFTILGRVLTFSTDVGFKLYKTFKGEKTL